jgi:hypothetical protein
MSTGGLAKSPLKEKEKDTGVDDNEVFISIYMYIYMYLCCHIKSQYINMYKYYVYT